MTNPAPQTPRAPGLANMTLRAVLDATSAKAPTPGGGAIAGVIGALGCALAGMVVSYSVGRKDLAAFHTQLTEAQQQLKALSDELVTLGDADALAYAHLNALQKLLPTDPHRVAELPGAVDAAVGVPMRCLRVCEQLAALCQTLAPITNKHLRSDLAIAAAIARAAAQASAINVRINLPLVDDAVKRAALERQSGASEARAAELAAYVLVACQ